MYIDVYKRQELALSKGLIVKDLDIKMPASGEFSTMKDYSAFTDAGEPETADAGVTYNGIYTAVVSMTPVSYTHLDVYKRQLFILVRVAVPSTSM